MAKKFLKNLSHDFIFQKNGAKTSIFFSENSQKPLAILIHGLGGSALGMSFLAEKMAKNWQIVIVELPSHGKSSLQKIETARDLRIWNDEILEKIAEKFQTNKQIDILILHSMACFSFSAKTARKIPTVIINPVFEATKTFENTSKLSAKSPLFSILSNLTIFSPIKALLLTKIFTFGAIKNVVKNTIFAFNSFSQRINQGKMSKIVLEKPLLSANSKNVAMIFIGEKDVMTETLTDENRKKFFPRAKIETAKTGHLLPIEIPEFVAEKIEIFLPK